MMAKCFICSNKAKATLSDNSHVCNDCWFQAGFLETDLGYGANDSKCILNAEEFASKLQSEIAKRNYSEKLIQEWVRLGSFGYIGFDDQSKAIVFKQKSGPFDGIYLYQLYSYDDLIDADITDKSTVYKPGALNRAVIGDSATSYKEMTITNDKVLVLFFNDGDKTSQIKTPGNQIVFNKIRSILDSRLQNPSSSNPGSSINSEALIKLKELLDMGILTDEEFQVKKKELLDL